MLLTVICTKGTFNQGYNIYLSSRRFTRPNGHIRIGYGLGIETKKIFRYGNNGEKGKYYLEVKDED